MNQVTKLFDSPIEAAHAMGIPFEGFSDAVAWTFELDTDDASDPPTQHLSIRGASLKARAVKEAAHRLAALAETTVETIQFEDGTSEFLIEMPNSRYHRITWAAQLATTGGTNQ